MNVTLKMMSGRDAGKEYPLLAGENLIGRSRSAHVRVYNEDVSGKHFIVDVADNSITLHNLSHYGTRLDGVLVQDEAELHSGQILEAGKTLKFVIEQHPDATSPESPDVIDETGVTRFVGDVSPLSSVPDDASDSFDDETGVTRLVGERHELKQERDEERNSFGDETSATRFIADTLSNSEKEVTPSDAGSPQDEGTGTAEDGNDNNDTQTSFTALQQTSDAMTHSVTKEDQSNANIISDETASRTKLEVMQEIGTDATGNADAGSDAFFSESHEATSSDSIPEEQGAFFADDDLDESEKTSTNETQIVQTRMANMDEINFIKEQIKKQRQSRLFFKFLIFALLFVFLGVIWLLKAPQQENILSWPQKNEKGKAVYLTGFQSAFGNSHKDGGFDVYYPLLSNTKVNNGPDTITISTFLGKKADVPLTIVLQKEESLEFIYENRSSALKNMMRRLSERKGALFNFDYTPNKSFLIPNSGPSQNGILCDTIAYQLDAEDQRFGILRFFRRGKYNYILRAEVPAEEKLRALPILTNDNFLVFSPDFVSSHWEGNDEYTKGDIGRIMLGVKDELLNRNSPMQFPRLERLIKSILAQSMYNNQEKPYAEAMELLRTLRRKQQQWYNGQKIRWFSALRENNIPEKTKIRNESEAVFSVNGDKRRYDILRDYWE